jgi:hypothetical protein
MILSNFFKDMLLKKNNSISLPFSTIYSYCSNKKNIYVFKARVKTDKFKDDYGLYICETGICISTPYNKELDQSIDIGYQDGKQVFLGAYINNIKYCMSKHALYCNLYRLYTKYRPIQYNFSIYCKVYNILYTLDTDGNKLNTLLYNPVTNLLEKIDNNYIEYLYDNKYLYIISVEYRDNIFNKIKNSNIIGTIKIENVLDIIDKNVLNHRSEFTRQAKVLPFP